jgi:hypothetical protein
VPIKACVVSEEGASRGGPLTVANVKGPCGAGDSCSEGTCQTWNACLKSSTSKCGCELGPVPMAPGASVALLAALALGLTHRSSRR